MFGCFDKSVWERDGFLGILGILLPSWNDMIWHVHVWEAWDLWRSAKTDTWVCEKWSEIAIDQA